MSRWMCLIALSVSPSTIFAGDKPNTLTQKEIEEGWILLFDGETTFGWKTEGDVKVADGKISLGGKSASSIQTSCEFPPSSIDLEYSRSGKPSLKVCGRESDFFTQDAVNQWASMRIRAIREPKVMFHDIRFLRNGREFGAIGISGGPPEEQLSKKGAFRIEVPAGDQITLHSIKLRPFAMNSLFNAKDLSGWKVFDDPKRNASKWSVTKEGWLNVKNGPGDLQTEKKFDNFILQFECISNGKALNSGIFFRCIENQYQNGYEAQVQNGFKDNDRTKPADFGTGAIYRRIAARKVVPNDNEWFTMTVLAHGKHIATWVNGYQTVDWTDDRKENENPRNGYRAAAGHISIQGHDVTTDLSFRNIRIVELKGEKKN